MAKRASDQVQIHVRMRHDQFRRLEREAEKRNQTFNAEILTRLDRSFETDGLVGVITGGSSANALLLNLIARCAYVLPGWERSSDEDGHRVLEVAFSLLIKGIRKGSITEADMGVTRETPSAEARGRALAYSMFNRTIGKERP